MEKKINLYQFSSLNKDRPHTLLSCLKSVKLSSSREFFCYMILIVPWGMQTFAHNFATQIRVTAPFRQGIRIVMVVSESQTNIF